MALLRLMALLALAALATSAQQYSGGSNYVENDYDYEAPQAAPAPRPPPRSFSRPSPSPIRQSGPPAPRATPVPILKQINRHNEDGSYTYGYEGADGSFKIETKLQSGEVMGKYGYVDDLGKVRVVEYGANKYGFQPAGEGITVAPPTLVDETKRREGEIGGGVGGVVDYDDGQYYEPVPARPQSASRFASRPAPAPRPVPRPAPPPPPQPQPSPSYDTYESEQSFVPAPSPAPRPAPPRPSSGSSFGPVPSRAQIPGAIPAGGSSTGIIFSQPRPSAPRPQSFTQPSPLLRQQQPIYHAQPIAPQPIAPSRPQARQSGGLLDQLAKDYALPPGGQPLHDISFGFY